MRRAEGLCVTRDALAIAGSGSRNDAFTTSISKSGSVDRVTDVYAQHKEFDAIGTCHVAVGPSVAQVRRIHTLSPDLAPELLLRLIRENADHFFVGAAGSLTVMSAARAHDGSLWAWAVDTEWYESFMRKMTASRATVKSFAPATRVLFASAATTNVGQRVRDGDIEAVIIVHDGCVEEEWREPGARGDALNLASCARAAFVGQGSAFLSTPTRGERAEHNTFRRIRIAASITVAAVSIALLKPFIAHLSFTRRVVVEQRALQIAYGAAGSVLELEKKVLALRSTDEQLSRVTSPVVETLATIAGVLGDESILTSFRIDSASVDMTVTTPSTSALLDSLTNSGRFGDIRLVGGVTRTLPAHTAVALHTGSEEPAREDRVTVHMQLKSGTLLVPMHAGGRQLVDRTVGTDVVGAYGSNR